MATGAPPRTIPADISVEFDGPIHIEARAPKPSSALVRFQDTLLYNVVLLLPPGALVGSTPEAREGHRRVMLNAVSAALTLAADGHTRPTLGVLGRLLARMDGAGSDWVQDDPGTREDERAQLYELVQEVMESLSTETEP
jgi:hypothetical protein